MKRFKSSFAVPSGFAVATRPVAGAMSVQAGEKITGGLAGKTVRRTRQASTSTVAERAA